VRSAALAQPAVWCAVACCVFGTAAADDYLSLPTTLQADLRHDPSERMIRIPRKPGPEADQTLIDLGRQIEDVDKTLRRKAQAHSLSDAQLTALVDARNLAVLGLVEGQDVLTHTSGGEFPRQSKNELDGYLAQIMKGLTSPSGRDIVKTNITFSGNPTSVVLMYQSYADHSLKSSEWSTYTNGQLITVGTYIFRVRSLSSQAQCEETIPVLAEPTEKTICGAFRP
jgi:hypothetical protein